MAIELPDLNSLNQTAVDEAHAYIVQRVAEYAPNIESKRGVLHDILFHLEAILQTGQDEYADKLRKSGSLIAISANPADATDEIVDAIASNFRATRFTGTRSSGKAVIVISQFVPSSVSSNNVFSANGAEFAPTSTFFGRMSSSQIVADTDRLIKPVGDGTYYYTVDMEALEVGSSGNLKRNTKLTPSTSIPYFVTAYAEGSFSDGSDYESNAELVKRMQEGISSKNLSNRLTIDAMIRSEAAFASVLDISSVGYGDPEQTRYHSVFPTATGNRLDMYVRSADLPTVSKLDKTATLVGRSGGGGLWQVAILKDDLPGFYDVVKVLKATVTDSDSQTGLVITSDFRGYNLSDEPSTFIPDVTSAIEAAYSPLQTAVILFEDPATTTDTVIGSTASYSVFVRGMPLIREIHDFVSGRDVRPASGDVIVKAPIPCDLRLSLVLYKKPNDPDIDTVTIKNNIANVVNKLGFTGRLSASVIHSEIHKVLTSGQNVGPIEMFGRVRKPDGTYQYVRSFGVIEIPTDYTTNLSKRTCAFILDPEDIGISVELLDDASI
jgi:hypothetical protein